MFHILPFISDPQGAKVSAETASRAQQRPPPHGGPLQTPPQQRLQSRREGARCYPATPQRPREDDQSGNLENSELANVLGRAHTKRYIARCYIARKKDC